jgi:hypothetical protein
MSTIIVGIAFFGFVGFATYKSYKSMKSNKCAGCSLGCSIEKQKTCGY